MRTQRSTVSWPAVAATTVALFPPLTASAAQTTHDDVVLEEITVTAQHRKQSLQDVPISVVAYGGDEVDKMGITGLDRLVSATPSVNLQSYSTSSYTNVLIRGVGSNLSTQGVEQGVAMYVDDVFIGTFQAYNFGLLDIDRIEVLRGPQGTLYGKNALGGAIRLLSATPTDQQEMLMSAAYGNDNLYRARLTANMPASENLAFRVAVGASGHDPYIPNTAGSDLQDQNQLAVRAQALMRFSDKIDFNLGVDWSGDDHGGYADMPYDSVEQRTVALDGDNFEERNIQGATGTLNYRADAFTLTSITGYRKLDLRFGLDSDHSGLPMLQGGATHAFRQFSQEIRAVSKDEKATLQWVAGAYYYTDRSKPADTFQLLDLGPLYGVPYGYTERSSNATDTRSYSAFVDGTYRLSSRVGVSAGLRYTRESKDVDYVHVNNLAGFPGLFAPSQTQHGSQDFSKVTPRVVLNVDWTNDFMTYASAALGVKGGGFNATFIAAGPPLDFGPEEGWNYEVGMKTSWLERRLRINTALFYFDWKDQQVQAFVQSSTGVSLISTTNAARSVSKGADVEVWAQPAAWLELMLAYSYNDAQFTSYRNSPNGDLTDHPLPLNSKDSFRASAVVTRQNPWGASFNAVFRGDYSYKSESFFDLATTLRQGGYGLFNARLGVEADTWSVYLFGTNLGDTVARTSGFPTLFGALSATVNDPRSYGIEVSFRR